MTANAFAVSRRLVEKGVAKDTAEAIAEEIVTHSDENLATKADIARLEGKIETLAAQVRMLMVLIGGLYVGLALLLVDRLAG